MDLYAYSQLDDLKKLLDENNISIPRLRGIRAMWNEKEVTTDEMEEIILTQGLSECELLIRADFDYDTGFECSSRTDKNVRKYIKYDKNGYPIGIRWDKVHGRKRKAFKFIFKNIRKKVLAEYSAFNKYCGRQDVLYVHTRIGGCNWPHYNGPEIAKQPWFIEKVQDCYDSTYCTIYVKIAA